MVADNRPQWADAEVLYAELITDRIRRITLARPPSRRAPAGSHVDVSVNLADGRNDVRSYSVVESSDDGAHLTISVLLTPDSRGGSRFMHALQPGARVPCTQPLQNFELRLGAARHILLAGGVGITALLAMAEVLRGVRADYDLVYVGRSREQMAYLDRLAETHGDRLSLHVDDEGTALDVAAFVKDVASGTSPRDTELYMCGPIRLMDACRRAWAEEGLPAHNLRFETFGNSGWFDAEEFDVVIPRLGIEAVVGKDSTILETLVAAGAEMMFDCRKGECGLCQVEISGLDGELDHRDVFLSEDQQKQGRHLCTCVSRAVGGKDGRRALLSLDLP
jgi:ferredoxin-NADP reductase